MSVKYIRGETRKPHSHHGHPLERLTQRRKYGQRAQLPIVYPSLPAERSEQEINAHRYRENSQQKIGARLVCKLPSNGRFQFLPNIKQSGDPAEVGENSTDDVCYKLSPANQKMEANHEKSDLTNPSVTLETRDANDNSESKSKPKEVGFEDSESLQMFLSTDNLEKEEEYQKARSTPRATLRTTKYSEDNKQKQEEIIRRVLDHFDLDETMTKYRNFNSYEYRRKGKSLEDFRFRSELIRMMGSEIIRLNDQSWSQKFQQKLREDYEKQLEEQNQNLADVERQRLHRLRIEGIITSSISPSSDDLMKKAFTNRKITMFNRKPSLSKGQATKPIFLNEELNERERTLSARRQKNLYQPARSIESQITMKQKDESAMDMRELHSSSDVEFSGDALERAIDKLAGRGKDSPTLMERKKKRHKKLPPELAQLYEEESVAGLYKLAEKLVDL